MNLYTLHDVLHDASCASLSVFIVIVSFHRHNSRSGASCLRLRDLSYISPYDDCCGVFGPVKAVQHSMCAAVAAAFTRNYSDDFVFMLLASPDP